MHSRAVQHTQGEQTETEGKVILLLVVLQSPR